MKFLSVNAIFALLSVADISPADAFLSPSVSTASPKRHGSVIPSLLLLRESKASEPQTETASSSADADSRGKEVLEDLFFREADAIFDSIDANNDGEISNDELRGHLEKKGYPSGSIRLLFTAVDKNADGAISREEMRYAFSTYEISALYSAFGLGGLLAPKDSRSDEKDYEEAVSKIRSKAFSNGHTYAPEMLTKLADMIFDMIDIDGSGEIDGLELRMHFAAAAAAAADGSTTTTTTNPRCVRETGEASASVDSVLKALDINSDGKISREEMRNGFRQYDPSVLSSALGLRVSRKAEA